MDATTSASNVSASLGGTIDFDLNFPLTEAGHPYQLLASRSGVGPTRIVGVEIPLTRDAFLLTMLQSPPPFFTGLTGTLDGLSMATAGLNLPAGAASSLADSTVHFSAVTLNPLGRPMVASWPVALNIMP